MTLATSAVPFSGIQVAFYAIASLPILFGIVLIILGIIVIVKFKKQ